MEQNCEGIYKSKTHKDEGSIQFFFFLPFSPKNPHFYKIRANPISKSGQDSWLMTSCDHITDTERHPIFQDPFFSKKETKFLGEI